MLFVFHPGRGSGVPILQSKPLALRNAKGPCQARGLFDEFVAFHGFGSVVQTWRSEQRAESPAEGGGAVVGMEDGIVQEGKESVHTENIYRVIGTNGNLDAGHSPPELDSRGAVEHAVCCAQQDWLSGTQPVGEQQAGTEVAEGGGFRPASEREAVFGIGGGDKICARRRSGIRRCAARCEPGCYCVGAELPRTKPAHQLIS